LEKIKQFIRVLLVGYAQLPASKHQRHPILNQYFHLKRVWTSRHYADFGIERLIRLFLAAILFVFPGLYFRAVFSSLGLIARKIAVDFYVLIKMMIPVIFFYLHLTSYLPVAIFSAYMGAETLVYLASLIYLSNEFAQPISYRRSLTALFFNYIEICLDYAVIYSYCNCNLPHFFKEKLTSGMQAVYFSFATSATVGFGDIAPVHKLGQALVITQIIIFLIFVGLFINFFSSRIHDNTQYREKERNYY
jgi:hypothetical protein